MNGRNVKGRGVKAGYWEAVPEPGAVGVTLGCDRNPEFWATVRLTRADLDALLEMAFEVPADPGPGPSDDDRKDIPL